MRSLLLIFTSCLFAQFALAEPTREVLGMIEEPVSLFDLGMLQMERDFDWLSDRFRDDWEKNVEGCSFVRIVNRFDYEEGKIVAIFILWDMEGVSTREERKEWATRCFNFSDAGLSLALGKSDQGRLMEWIQGWFKHADYSTPFSRDFDWENFSKCFYIEVQFSGVAFAEKEMLGDKIVYFD